MTQSNTLIPEPVKHLPPEGFQNKCTPLNKYDRAKMRARKYAHLCRRLKNMSRQKIKSDAQVRYIEGLIIAARIRVKESIDKTNKGTDIPCQTL